MPCQTVFLLVQKDEDRPSLAVPHRKRTAVADATKSVRPIPEVGRPPRSITKYGDSFTMEESLYWWDGLSAFVTRGIFDGWSKRGDRGLASGDQVKEMFDCLRSYVLHVFRLRRSIFTAFTLHYIFTGFTRTLYSTHIVYTEHLFLEPGLGPLYLKILLVLQIVFSNCPRCCP